MLASSVVSIWHAWCKWTRENIQKSDQFLTRKPGGRERVRQRENRPNQECVFFFFIFDKNSENEFLFLSFLRFEGRFFSKFSAKIPFLSKENEIQQESVLFYERTTVGAGRRNQRVRVNTT